MRQTIMIADNDRDTVRSLADHLATAAFEAVFVDNGRDVRREMERRNPSLVVLGTNFGDVPGLELARWVLNRPARPGLILLSSRADPIDRTIGLEMGADDYVSKPFFARELVARMHSVLRRLRPGPHEADVVPAPMSRAEVVSILGYSVNLSSRQVTLPDGDMATLSWTESKVLSALLDHRGVPVTRDILSQRALGRPWSPEERALDQHVAALRRKLHAHPPAKPLITTIRHVGYSIEA